MLCVCAKLVINFLVVCRDYRVKFKLKTYVFFTAKKSSISLNHINYFHCKAVTLPHSGVYMLNSIHHCW